MPQVIGVDVGGTKIEAVLFDGKKVLKSVRVHSEADRSYKEMLRAMANAVEKVRTPQVTAIGLATPGYVHDGKLYCTPNNINLLGKAVAKDLQKLTKLPVVHENDAKCFALAESRVGAGKGKPNVIGVIVGTGIGAGIMLNGKIYRGAIGAAGEIGHSPCLDKDYEYYGAGPGIARTYKAAGGARALTAADILPYVKSQKEKEDNAIKTAQDSCYDALGKMSATLIDTLNPDVIVYGGGVSKSLDYKRLRKETRKYALPEPFAACKQVKHSISDSAGSIGAALLALESLKK